MKGLLIKDYINLKKQSKILLLFLIGYGIFAIITDNTGFLSGMVMIFCMILPVTSYSYDEYTKWDRFALATPIAKQTLVASKYVLSIILAIICFLSVTVVNIIMVILDSEIPFLDMLLTNYSASIIALLIISTIIPAIVKLGVEKARLFMMVIIFIPFGAIALFSQFDLSFLQGINIDLIMKSILYISPIFTAIYMLLSIKLATSFYQAKEI